MALQTPDLVFLDLMLPDGSGMRLLEDNASAPQQRDRADDRARRRGDVGAGACAWVRRTTC
jgi:CheY-like chemotaxis protein